MNEASASGAASSGDMASAGVLRRFGAMLYDGLLVIALLALVTFAFIPFLGGRVLVPSEVGALAYFYRIVQCVVIIGFFGYFWTHSGQTVGMLAWRLKLMRADGAPLRWREVIARLAAACVSWAALGLGYFWIWIDRDRLAWHDRWTATRVIVLPKRPRS